MPPDARDCHLAARADTRTSARTPWLVTDGGTSSIGKRIRRHSGERLAGRDRRTQDQSQRAGGAESTHYYARASPSDSVGAMVQSPNLRGPDLRMQPRAALPAPSLVQASRRLAAHPAPARRDDLANTQRPRLPDHRRPLLRHPRPRWPGRGSTSTSRTGRATRIGLSGMPGAFLAVLYRLPVDFIGPEGPVAVGQPRYPAADGPNHDQVPEGH